MLRGIMDTTRAADKNSNYSVEILRLLSLVGVNFVSTVLTVSRPFCEYPWDRQTGRWNEAWWARLDTVISVCNYLGLGLQLDLFNEPSLRHGNPLCYPEADPALVRKTPTGAWAKQCRAYIQRVVPLANELKLGAILYVLEGSNSRAFEAWCHNEAQEAGLSPKLLIISNSVKNYPGVIHSPHVHSLADVKRHAHQGAYLSDDGAYPMDEKKIASWSKAALNNGCVAYETLLGGCLSGEQPLDEKGEPKGGHADYDERKRPTIEQLTRGIVPRMVGALVRA